MIYLKNKTGRQGLRVPVSGLGEGDGTPAFRLRSTTGNKDVYDADWQDGVAEVDYLRGTVGLPAGLKDGEYEYELSQDGQTLARGVAQVGDYKAVPVQRSDETITFNQYGRKN